MQLKLGASYWVRQDERRCVVAKSKQDGWNWRGKGKQKGSGGPRRTLQYLQPASGLMLHSRTTALLSSSATAIKSEQPLASALNRSQFDFY